MIPPEVADLRDILLNDLQWTNNENHATRWARQIIEKLKALGYDIVSTDTSRPSVQK
jgi:threonine aldolase